MGKLVATQVVMAFVRRTPMEEEALDELADACLEAINRDARFLAFGPVVSADYGRSAIEVEFTACTETDAKTEVDERIARVGEIVRSALMSAEYATTSQRIAVPA
jgi:hypothetical protein